MVEVFKTNVTRGKQAKKLAGVLSVHFPGSKINFDLDDCDKVLRIEGRDISVGRVEQLVAQNGFYCKELE